MGRVEKEAEKMNEKYDWKKSTMEFHKDRGEEVWILTLFSGEKKNRELPFLDSQNNVATHEIEISTFDPKPYKRPYITEKISEDEETITYKKIFLSDYKGNIDTEFYVRYLGSLDAEGRYIAYFLNGDMKRAFDNYGRNVENPGAFKKNLTDYFEIDPSFGEHLINLITNSNLPEKQKKAVRCLIE